MSDQRRPGIDLAQGFRQVAVPQGPLESLQLLAYGLTQFLIVMAQTFGVLVQYCELHRVG